MKSMHSLLLSTLTGNGMKKRARCPVSLAARLDNYLFFVLLSSIPIKVIDLKALFHHSVCK